MHAVFAALCAVLVLACHGQHPRAQGLLELYDSISTPQQAAALERVLGGTVNLCAPPMSCAVNPIGSHHRHSGIDGGALSTNACVDDAKRASSWHWQHF